MNSSIAAARSFSTKRLTGGFGWTCAWSGRPSGSRSPRWQNCSVVTSRWSPGTCGTSFRPVNWSEEQLLQKLQQLPRTARPTRSNTSTSTPSSRLATASTQSAARSSASGRPRRCAITFSRRRHQGPPLRRWQQADRHAPVPGLPAAQWPASTCGRQPPPRRQRDGCTRAPRGRERAGAKGLDDSPGPQLARGHLGVTTASADSAAQETALAALAQRQGAMAGWRAPRA